MKAGRNERVRTKVLVRKCAQPWIQLTSATNGMMPKPRFPLLQASLWKIAFMPFGCSERPDTTTNSPSQKSYVISHRQGFYENLERTVSCCLLHISLTRIGWENDLGRVRSIFIKTIIWTTTTLRLIGMVFSRNTEDCSPKGFKELHARWASFELP